MKRQILWISVSLSLAVACGSGSTSTSPSTNTSQAVLPSPDPSAPQRFRPFIGQLIVSPTAIRVGEVAVVTGSVRTGSGMPSSEMSWILVPEPTSVGNGVLSDLHGSGDLRAEFRANYKGEVTLVA